MKIDVLDKGHIELVDTLGDDLASMLRVSFGFVQMNSLLRIRDYPSF